MKRAQAAMEFILTYGWAIMMMLAGISALVYFGIFNNNTSPERCVFSSGLSCKEFAITAKTATTNNLTLYVQNNVGEAITINAVNITGEKQAGSCNPQISDMKSDGITRIECQFQLFNKKTVKLQSIITYKKVLGDYNHTVQSEIVVNT